MSESRSLLAPLKIPLFRSLWIASVVSNIGSQMHTIGAAWEMTLLTPSPLLLGMVSVMANAPLLFLSPLAGAVTDLSDRRRLLLTTQSFLAFIAGSLAVFAAIGRLNPTGLLALTAMRGLVTVFNANCWHTLVQDSVPRAQLAPAVSLNSISVNTARSLGPALGGVLIAWMGTGMVFLLNALSFFGIIFVAARWRETRVRKGDQKLSAVFKSLGEGFSYLCSNRPLGFLLLRHLIFITAGVSIITLLPILVRDRLGLDSKAFGLLASCFGLGAIIASLCAHSLAHRYGIRQTTRAGMTLSILVLFSVAICSNRFLMGGLLLLQGFSGTFIALNHGVRVRMSAPPAFAGRVFSYYLVCATGGMALGGFIFGWIASCLGIGAAIIAAGFLSITGLLLAIRHPMPDIHQEIEEEAPQSSPLP